MGVTKKGENWFIDYYFQGKRIREKIGTSKSLAELAMNKRKVEIAENKHLDVKKTPRVKFEDLAKSYMELHSVPNKRSHKRDLLSIRHLSGFFGGRQLHDINSLDVEKYKQKRKEEGPSEATINRELACLKHMFTKAIEWDMAVANPVRKVKLFRENNKRIRYLEEDEAEKLLTACAPFLKPVVAVALNTGMRKGEIFNLKWQDIDFQQGTIHIERTKSGERREIPMNSTVSGLLKGLSRLPGCDYVFHKDNGEPFKDVRWSFEKACRAVGIENFRFHDLRHTFASHMVMKGADLKVVQEFLGHKTYIMTLRYAHLSPSYKGKIIERINFGSGVDILWTPNDFSDTINSADELLKSAFTDDKSVNAGMAELADAADLKSAEV